MTETTAAWAGRWPVVGCDLLRVAALVSVVVATLGHGVLGFALFMLVLGGTMVPRALGAPAPLDAAFCSMLLLAGWAAQLDWYVEIRWLDVVVHATVTGLVAAVGYVALTRLGAYRAGAPRAGVAITTTCLGVALAVLWELGEWIGHTWIDERIQVGYDDTVGDLTAGAAGAVVAAVLLAAYGVRRGTSW